MTLFRIELHFQDIVIVDDAIEKALGDFKELYLRSMTVFDFSPTYSTILLELISKKKSIHKVLIM
jgi:hypothetical protein